MEQELEELREENRRLKNLLKIVEKNSKKERSLQELVDIKKLEDIFERFTKLTGYPTSLISQDTNEVLVSSGFHNMCMEKHKDNEDAAKICNSNNQLLIKQLEESKSSIVYMCEHGMVDGATPITIDEKQIATILSGQIVCERPDVEAYEDNSSSLQKYMESLADVKVVSQERLDEVLGFLSAIVNLIAEMSKEKRAYIDLSTSLEEKINERLKEQSSLLSLFDNSNSVLFKWRSDEKWSVEFVSKSVSHLLGYTKEEFEKNSISYLDCIHPDDLANVATEVESNTALRNSFFTHEPYRVITKDGEEKWVLDNTVIVRDAQNNPTDYLGYLSDVTIFKVHADKLEYLSVTDQLTKVYNRLYIDESLQKQYYRYCRNKEECSVILIDIDFFKLVNDNFGHSVGDLFLVEFSKILQENVRSSDIVGRWGGEEFLIILPHTNIEDAYNLAMKLRELIANKVFTKVGHKTASFGVSGFTEGISVEKMIDNADKALYASKENGRNQVRCL